MGAEELRRAAAEMRAKASMATAGPWEDFAYADGAIFVERVGEEDDDQGTEVARTTWTGDATHIAAWSPPVAHVVADWLDAMAVAAELPGGILDRDVERQALAVARAFLGASA